MTTEQQTVSNLLMQIKKIKDWQKESNQKLKELYEQLAPFIEFKENCLTGHVYSEDLHLIYQRRTNTKYDQDLLNIAMQKIGEAPFEAVFKREYKPRSKAILKKFFETATDEQKEIVQKAIQETEGAPSITLEPIGEEYNEQ